MTEKLFRWWCFVDNQTPNNMSQLPFIIIGFSVHGRTNIFFLVEYSKFVYKHS
jgi:hypothetical protein